MRLASGHPTRDRESTVTGVGLGLRWDFIDELVERIDAGTIAVDEVPFFEISPENYLRRGGYIPEALEYVADRFPLISHGLQMSLGGLDPYDERYFEQMRRFLQHFGAPWHSDHLCFSSIEGRALHDLLPLPHTEAAARHVAARVREAQDRLGVPMAVENISYYLPLGAQDISEPELVSAVLEEADCGLLLDVNNVYVNSLNHGGDPQQWIEQLDLDRVVQLHVAGHEHRPAAGIVLDTHGTDVVEPVHDLLEWTIARTGPRPVTLERDNNIPPLDELLEERRRVDASYRRGLERHRQRHLQEAS